MGKVNFKGNPVNTSGELPKLKAQAPDFKLTRQDLSDVRLGEYAGRRKVLNIFPSIDTPTCATSVRKFNERAANLENTVVLCISADLPFAQKRFCAAEGLKNVETLSTFRSPFAREWGLELIEGPLTGLCSRAVVVVDEHDRIVYAQQVPELGNEPDYDGAIKALG